MVAKKKAGKKHSPSGRTHLTESDRTRFITSFAACDRASNNSSSSASVIEPPVTSDLEIIFIVWESFGYFVVV